jgi:hypothetical protein
LWASRFIALGNEQRRSSLGVGLLPDVDVGTAISQQLYDRREIATIAFSQL